jgi:hypothetical protein
MDVTAVIYRVLQRVWPTLGVGARSLAILCLVPQPDCLLVVRDFSMN